MNKDKQLCCNVCCKDNIEWQVWADEFDVVSDGDGTRDVWCHDCEEETRAVLKPGIKIKAEREINE